MAKEAVPSMTPEEIDVYERLGIDSLLQLLEDALNDLGDVSLGEERPVDRVPGLIKEINDKRNNMTPEEIREADKLIAQAERLLNTLEA